MFRPLTVVSLALLSINLTAASSGKFKQTRRPFINWVNCKDFLPTSLAGALSNATLDALPSTLHCGRIEVPVDYSEPLCVTNNIARYTPDNPRSTVAKINFLGLS